MFLIFIAAMVYLMLRRLGCSSCHYCKSCTSGFGRLAGWLFGNRSAKDLNNKTALGFVIIIYFVLGLLPIATLTLSLAQTFDMPRFVLLLCILAVTLMSAIIWLRLQAKKKHVFKTVEIDSTFHRVPSKGTGMGWLRYSPSDFVFNAKIRKPSLTTGSWD